MANNKDLNWAKTARKDEFYTQLTDIEKELRYYKKHFKDKVIFCNCDDPFESEFFRYFVLNFNRLHLKKLICTCYAGSPIMGEQITIAELLNRPEVPQETPYRAIVNTVYDKTGDGSVDMFDVAELFRSGENELTELEGDGDFRSDECINLLKQADIVVTNPPFSMFREYVAQLMEYDKKFIIIGNINAVTFKDFFPLIKEDKVWIGASIHSGDRAFFVPDDYPLDAAGCGIDEATGRKYIRVKGVRWFTNLDIKQRHEEMILVKRYDPEQYPSFVNYDGINVSMTADIPCDYSGPMGVPITFLDRYCPDQFEIIGIDADLRRPMSDIANKGEYRPSGTAMYYLETDETAEYKYHATYRRIFIRNKHPEEPKK